MTISIYPATWGEYYGDNLSGYARHIVIYRGQVEKSARLTHIIDSGKVIYYLYWKDPSYFSLQGDIADTYWREITRRQVRLFENHTLLKADRRWVYNSPFLHKDRIRVYDSNQVLVMNLFLRAIYLRFDKTKVMFCYSSNEPRKTYSGVRVYKVPTGDYLLLDRPGLSRDPERKILTRLVDNYHENY